MHAPYVPGKKISDRTILMSILEGKETSVSQNFHPRCAVSLTSCTGMSDIQTFIFGTFILQAILQLEVQQYFFISKRPLRVISFFLHYFASMHETITGVPTSTTISVAPTQIS